MKLFRPFAALSLFAAAACTTAAGGRSDSPSFYVMRHLQKGEGVDPALSDVGRRNADYLPGLLERAPPRAIYASTTRRARETAQPAAERFGVSIQDYDPKDTPALVARVRAEKGPVLIVGHSNTVPAIVEALGGGRIGEIGENDYGMLYTIFAGKPWAIRSCVGADCTIVGVDDDQ